MRMTRKAIFGLAAFCALCLSAASCIDDTTTYNYMEGNITFDIDDYIYTGDVVELSAGGITLPADGINWGWVITTIHTDTLYAPTIVVQFPDTPAEYTVKALAYHPDYIVESGKKTVTTVDTTHMTGSLQGLPYDTQKVFTDSRDGRSYRYEKIGSLDWFAENLAWEGAGYSYCSSPVMDHVFGRLYTWQEATDDICPAGWHLPSNADWEDLGGALCGSEVAFADNWPGAALSITPDAYFNGERLWPFSVNNTHQVSVNFNPLPCGYMQVADGGFYGLGTYGMWWSATPRSSSESYFRYIYWDSADLRVGATSNNSIALSVRCVR